MKKVFLTIALLFLSNEASSAINKLRNLAPTVARARAISTSKSLTPIFPPRYMTSKDFFDSIHGLSDDEKIERINARAYDYPTKISDFKFLVDHLDNHQTAEDLLWFCRFLGTLATSNLTYYFKFMRRLENNFLDISKKLRKIQYPYRKNIEEYLSIEIDVINS